MGLRYSQLGQGIVDGAEAGTHDARSTAALLLWGEVYGKPFGELACSAVLIAQDAALTAAHCLEFYDVEANQPDLDVGWYLSFEPDLRDFDVGDTALPSDAVRVRATVLHPEFSISRVTLPGLQRLNDAALLLLEKPVVGIEPSLLLLPEQAAELQAGRSTMIAGYGQRGADSDAEEQGLKLYGSSILHAVGEYELQVGRQAAPGLSPARDLADKCYGDSGGPTFLETALGVRLIGIASRGFDARPDCEIAGIDTRVDSLYAWIATELSDACALGRRAMRDCAAVDGDALDGEDAAPGERGQDAHTSCAVPASTRAYPPHALTLMLALLFVLRRTRRRCANLDAR